MGLPSVKSEIERYGYDRYDDVRDSGSSRTLYIAGGLAIVTLAGLGIYLATKSGKITPKEARKGAANASNVASHKTARPVIQEALKSLLGRDPTLAEIQYGQAIAWLETNYGRGWKGPMVGSNNWGAVQCAKGSSLPCISYQDSYADGSKYDVSFRKYASPVEGAADMLRHVFKLRPVTASALKSPDGTVYRASYAMRREKYYEGFCPQATKKYGAQAVRASLANPDKTDATKACAAEAVAAHAKRADDIISQIAGSLNEPMAMPLGDYEDAGQNYSRTRVAADTDLAPPHGAIPVALLEVVR